ncbi:MAG: hypothetical protein QOH30_3401 [Baekduia sp.]|jgi:hypothetical protein|nr:hypothetical protein [Baekduia sp.]
MLQGRRICEVLLLGNPVHLGSTGRGLWAVFDEVEQLYNAGPQAISADRFCVTSLPAPDLNDTIPPECRLVIGEDVMEALLDLHSSGRYGMTVDGSALVQRVQELLADRGLGEGTDGLIVMMDFELAPPPEWRYILWQGEGRWGVVSIAAMDPDYWGDDDPDRSRVIKRRARAALASVIGASVLALERCGNPRCYLFESVDSVLRLDVMTGIGHEHSEFPATESIGFGMAPDADPGAVEPIVGPEGLVREGWPML